MNLGGATAFVAPLFIFMKFTVLQLAPLYRALVPDIHYGSIERIVGGLDREFVATGLDSYVCALYGSAVRGKLLECPRADDYDKQAEVVLHFLRNHNVDVVHIHRRNFVKSQAFDFCRTNNIPVLYTIHGLAEDLEKKFDSSINTAALKNVHINAVSHYQAHGLSRLFSVKKVIYNGVDTKLYQYVQHQMRNYFLFLGRLNKEKGVHTAIQFANKTKTQLIIAGNIADRDYFNADIKPHVDNANIRFLGELSDQQKIPFYQKAKAVLMLGKYKDPCPLVAMEALACGTPVIAFKIGGFPEIIKDGVSGLLLKSIDDGVKRVQELMKINHEACARRIEQKFSLHRMAQEYLSLYFQLNKK